MLKHGQKKNGKVDYRKVIDLDGQVVDIGFAYSELSKLVGSPFDENLYSELYPLLSIFSHKDISESFVDALKFGITDDEKPQDIVRGTLIVTIVISVFLLEYSKHNWLPRVARRDFRYKSQQMLRALRSMLTKRVVSVARFPPSVPSIIKSCLIDRT